jgi:hypothetical protein
VDDVALVAKAAVLLADGDVVSLSIEIVKYVLLGVGGDALATVADSVLLICKDSDAFDAVVATSEATRESVTATSLSFNGPDAKAAADADAGAAADSNSCGGGSDAAALLVVAVVLAMVVLILEGFFFFFLSFWAAFDGSPSENVTSFEDVVDEIAVSSIASGFLAVVFGFFFFLSF